MWPRLRNASLDFEKRERARRFEAECFRLQTFTRSGVKCVYWEFRPLRRKRIDWEMYGRASVEPFGADDFRGGISEIRAV